MLFLKTQVMSKDATWGFTAIYDLSEVSGVIRAPLCPMQKYKLCKLQNSCLWICLHFHILLTEITIFIARQETSVRVSVSVLA